MFSCSLTSERTTDLPLSIQLALVRETSTVDNRESRTRVERRTSLLYYAQFSIQIGNITKRPPKTSREA